MSKKYKENQMYKLNEYAREYIENYDNNINYEIITKQMKEFSGAEYVMFNIFDENGKDFTLVGLEGNRKKINKIIDILGYNLIGKKFMYEEGRNEKFEESTITRIESLKELVGNTLPDKITKILEKLLKIDHILVLRIAKDKKTKGNFTLIFTKDQDKKDDETLKLFGSQVALYIDKKNSEQKKLESMERFQALLKNSVNIITIVDDKGNYVDISDSAAELIGINREEIIGKNFEEIIPEKEEEFMKAISTIKNTKKSITKKEIYNKNNEKRIYESIIFPIEEKENSIVLFGSIAKDITEKVKYEDKIKNERDYLYRIFNSMNQYVIVTGIDYRIQFMNEKAIKDFGNMEGEICFKQLDRKNPCEGCRLSEIKNIKDDESVQYTIKAFNKDLEISASKITNHDGSFSIVEVINDITEKKKDEQKILKMKERLENIIEGTNVGTWEWNIQTGETQFNDKWAEIIGYKLDELSPVSIKTWKELTHPLDLINSEKELKKVMNKELEYYDFELRMKHKNGQWVWIHDRGKVTKWSSNGEPLIMSGTHTDINDKKKVEEERYNEREKFKTTLMSVGDAIISTDKEGKINLMNNVAEKLTGWTQEKAYNQPLEKVLKIINEYTKKTTENPAEKALRLGKIVEMENHTILITKDGREIPIEDSAAPIKDRDDNVTGAVIVFRDFSEKRERQKEIEYLSFHDYLTGLYNRRYMEDSIKRLDTERNLPFSIIVTDVNGLKLTNDAYGHHMGDKLLLKVSNILKKSCREDDIISRVGGDEFVVLLPGTESKEAEEIKNRILKNSHEAVLDSVIISLAIGNSSKENKDKDILEVYKEADNKMYKNKLKYGRIMRNKTIETVLLNINNKYDHEQIHTERVSQYCVEIAKAIRLNDKEIEDAKIAGTLHDLGKIVVPPDILNKKDRLTYNDWETIKKHAVTSYQLLKSVDEYTHLAEAVLYHHERIDGTGYPEGLTEKEIPLLSKIIAVADAYEAMTANRPYQKKKTKEEAVKELKKSVGTQFDKDIVEVFTSKVL